MPGGAAAFALFHLGEVGRGNAAAAGDLRLGQAGFLKRFAEGLGEEIEQRDELRFHFGDSHADLKWHREAQPLSDRMTGQWAERLFLFSDWRGNGSAFSACGQEPHPVGRAHAVPACRSRWRARGHENISHSRPAG